MRFLFKTHVHHERFISTAHEKKNHLKALFKKTCSKIKQFPALKHNTTQ